MLQLTIRVKASVFYQPICLTPHWVAAWLELWELLYVSTGLISMEQKLMCKRLWEQTHVGWVVEVIIDLFCPHNSYTAKVRKLLEASAKECPVAQSLHPDLKQTIRFHFPE